VDPNVVWGGEWGQLRDRRIRRGLLSSKWNGQFWGLIWGVPLQYNGDFVV